MKREITHGPVFRPVDLGRWWTNPVDAHFGDRKLEGKGGLVLCQPPRFPPKTLANPVAGLVTRPG